MIRSQPDCADRQELQVLHQCTVKEKRATKTPHLNCPKLSANSQQDHSQQNSKVEMSSPSKVMAHMEPKSMAYVCLKQTK